MNIKRHEDHPMATGSGVVSSGEDLDTYGGDAAPGFKQSDSMEHSALTVLAELMARKIKLH